MVRTLQDWFNSLPKVPTGHEDPSFSLGQLSGHFFANAAGGPSYYKNFPRHRFLKKITMS